MDDMKTFYYLIYILAYEFLVLGGTGYAVFVLNQNGWWLIAGILMSGMAYPPERFMHGIIKDDNE